ncbi:MAG: hypothetical protein QM813_24390 [Verrucomicrobiota bacterium]
MEFDDFNHSYEAMDLSVADFYDQRHLTGIGAAKFTEYFAYEMGKRYEELHSESEDPVWEAQYEAYRAQRDTHK